MELVSEDDRDIEIGELIENDGLRGLFGGHRFTGYFTGARALMKTGVIGCRF